ncbi:hypothetical protein GIB67_021825 [Kingdonia uniflora]|uniref:Fanconi Anaemia group E protein C-terminal domain-containing protein n=1 Tax=Kingdonia uniflora TaxID=39325 RepID=A0A7J7P7J3_9MAGN|nr:hypothetical protein GIB67_021825 [Kingdonia uniflora]
MEAWVPLFDIFLNSPTPEGEASLWLQQSFDATTTTTTTTGSFLALLSKPIDVVINSSSPISNRIPYIQTLPNALQSRILSFLTVESCRFCARDLTSLANTILKGNQQLDFWVKKSAHNLLDKVSHSDFNWVSSLSLDESNDDEENVEEEFGVLPIWLQCKKSTGNVVLPWLPVSLEELNSSTPVTSSVDEKPDEVVEETDQMVDESQAVCRMDILLDPEVRKRAMSLKSQILVFESASKTIALANEVREMCVKGGDPFEILGLVEPWEVDDETASILVSHFITGDEEHVAWPSEVLCSVILPKLLVLNEPASRVLVTATITFCKVHQKAAVDALLCPLMFRKEGINNHLCDIMAKIIRECLHTTHVSAFLHKLFFKGNEGRSYICHECHEYLISDELIWTEPLLTLFQNILNHNVYLTQNSVDGLVSVIPQLVERYSKSLKFGNFLLCLVTKCSPLLQSHKLSLIKAVEQTNTFMTKSIISKLGLL